MRIDAVETRWLRMPFPHPIRDSTHRLEVLDVILVVIRAGEHYGTSYMISFDYAAPLLRGIVETELKRYVLGCPAQDIGAIRHICLDAVEYVGPEGLAMWGVSAIETALWDLLARRLNVPACELFGRQTRSVPAYGSGGWLSYTDEQLADEIGRHLRRGYGGVKIKIGGPSENFDVARAEAVRSMIGPDRKLMVDANQGLTLERALRTAHRLERCRVTWLEEPFCKHDLDSYRRLAAATEIPLAAGEREHGVAPLRRLIESRAVAVIQPDLMRVGGVTAWRQAAGLSDAFHLRLAPHFYKEFDVHLAACVSNLAAIEAFDWLDPLLKFPLEVRDGSALVPERPGFGLEFQAEAIAEFEYDPERVSSKNSICLSSMTIGG